MIKYLLDNSDKVLNKVFTGEVKPVTSFPDMPTVSYESYLADIKRYEDQEKRAALRLALNAEKQFKEREAEEIKKTERYAKKQFKLSAKTIRLLELGEPPTTPKPKKPKKISRKASRVFGYTREDVHIIASASLAVGLNSHANVPEDEFQQYLNDIMARSNKIINDYNEFTQTFNPKK